MPNKCSIVGCRGNYDLLKGDNHDNRVAIFRFPKNTDRCTAWLEKIPRKNRRFDNITSVTANMGVCERHFEPHFVIRTVSGHYDDGSVFTYPRDAPCLAKDAIPTIFPDVSAQTAKCGKKERAKVSDGDDDTCGLNDDFSLVLSCETIGKVLNILVL